MLHMFHHNLKKKIKKKTCCIEQGGQVTKKFLKEYFRNIF